MSLLPRVVGHRGAPRLAPENTVSSFQAAAAAGIKAVEFDVALTSDSRPIVIHDASLERTTDGSGLLADSTLESISGLDAGSWFSPSFSGEVIPTLEEVIDLFTALGLQANIELKPDPGREVEMTNIVLQTAQACWPSDKPPPVITSFSRIALATAKQSVPQWPRGLCFELLPEDWKDAAQTLGVAMLCPNAKELKADHVTSIIGAGLEVMAWTVNEVSQARELLRWGANSICSDIPQDLRSAVTAGNLV